MKTKLRWKFPPQSEMHSVRVFDIYHQDLPTLITLHACLFGYNEQGQVVKVLYCTRGGHFFTKNKNGWHEQIPATNRVKRGKSNKNAKAGGGFDTAFMRNFGNAKCYRLIAYAFCEWPEQAKTDPEWYKHFEVDHLNGDHSDNNPKNLRWVTPEVNRAWAKRCGREQFKDGAHKGCTLRGIGLDPKWIYYHNLRGISSLTDLQFKQWLQRVQEIMAADPMPLTIDNINLAVAQALDELSTNVSHLRENR